jgi:hypothetical protein
MQRCFGLWKSPVTPAEGVHPFTVSIWVALCDGPAAMEARECPGMLLCPLEVGLPAEGLLLDYALQKAQHYVTLLNNDLDAGLLSNILKDLPALLGDDELSENVLNALAGAIRYGWTNNDDDTEPEIELPAWCAPDASDWLKRVYSRGKN